MRKIWLTCALALALCVALMPLSAEAGAVIVPALAAAAGVTLSATATLIAIAAVNLAISLGISFLLGAAAAPDRPRQPDLVRDLGRPRSLPPLRYVYGHRGGVFGSPAPYHVDGDILYGCLILNSRASALTNWSVKVDKRPLTYTGDPFDFATGASVTGPDKLQDHLKFWLGKGDQTSPPSQILSEAGDTFTAADKWRGRTVLWFRADAGRDPNERLERWPKVPPEFEVEADWSLIWDPNDAAQDPDDPDTWTFSDNRALCLLDALRQNPARPYRNDQLHLESFKAAAVTDDDLIPLSTGGAEKRARVAGVIVWDRREVSEQVEPLVEAGGLKNDLIRIGGKLALADGTVPASELTLTDLIGGFTWDTLRPGRDLASKVATQYLGGDDRDWQLSALPVYEVPGAVSEDGGVPSIETQELGFVPSKHQAARLQKRLGFRLREQNALSCNLPPEAFDLVAGSGVTLDLPEPWSEINGLYRVEKIAPQIVSEREEEAGDVDLLCQAELREILAEGYNWNPSNETPSTGTGTGLTAAPASVEVPLYTLLSDSTTALNDGATITPRIKITATEAVSGAPALLQVQIREDGASTWEPGATIVRESGSATIGYVAPVIVGQKYETRARWLTGSGASEWSALRVITPAAPSVTLDAPTNGSAVAVSSSAIDVSYFLPNDVDIDGIEFWSGSTNDTGAMTVFHGPIYVAANATYTAQETGLSPSETRWYAARSVGPFGEKSAFSATVSATTNP